jgi:subtilisin family serine protease
VAAEDTPATHGDPKRTFHFVSGLELVTDPTWDDAGGSLDPSLRLAVALIEKQDRIQLLERTGIDTAAATDDQSSEKQQYLTVHIELNSSPTADTKEYLESRGLLVPSAYYDEAAHNDQLRCLTARLILPPGIVSGDAIAVREELLRLGTNKDREGLIKRISLGSMIQPCFRGASFDDIDMPAQRKVNGTTVDGSGIVVGIVDDGCAFAHLDFLKPGTTQSRVVYLWDQTPGAKPAGKGWTLPPGFNYGAEISNDPAGTMAIDAAIAARVLPNGGVDEDAVYSDLGYKMDDQLASHGTHVMGIAAGNGQSAIGFEGIAPKADIIFVQLPSTAIETGMSALTPKIQDAVLYIFNRAATLGKPAVVNISYGGYAGPHDGTSQIETAIDNWLAMTPGRAVVVSAGNGFEADCHAHDEVNPGANSKLLHWIVHPFDPTLNFMQIWYNGNATLKLWLTTPGGQKLGPVQLGDHLDIALIGGGPVVGWIDHQTEAGNGDKHIDINLRPTYDDPLFPPGSLPPSGAKVAPAPSGIWTVQLENSGNHRANVHAWIERDDAGHPGGARRRQSQFVSADADPKFTLDGLATGHLTIAVGAYNTRTHEVCRYSACGPTRPSGTHGHRQKPEVCAPGEEDAAGRGILSASSRKARATRMNGTSASAPHVAGLVALLMQYNASTGGAPLPTNKIRTRLKGAATRASLRPNRHNDVDRTRIVKQRTVFNDVIGDGKIDVKNTL